MTQQRTWESMKRAADLLVDFIESYNDKHPLKNGPYKKDLEAAFDVMADARGILVSENFRLQQERFDETGSFFEFSAENT